jgi:hypothetical protein
MKPLAIAVAAALLLAACETATKEVDLEQQFAQRCTARGYQPGTPEYSACLDDERQTRLIKRSSGRIY